MSNIPKLLLLSLTIPFVMQSAFGEERIQEATKKLQIAYDVDVVIAGGSVPAVAAAVSIAEKGHSVFLLTDRPYLGEDVCMHLAYLMPENTDEPLLKALWGGETKTTPMQVKRGLDQALLDSEVEFLTECYPAEVLLGTNGRVSGITIVNRSGRQIVKSKVVVDATEHAALARHAGVPLTQFEPGERSFTFMSVGGKKCVPNTEKAGFQFVRGKGKKHKSDTPLDVFQTSLTYPVKTGDWSEIAAIEQSVRNAVFRKGVAETSEALDYHLGTHLKSDALVTTWAGLDKLAPENFSHRSRPGIFVLGRYAAWEETVYAGLTLEVKTAVGRKVGEWATARASKLKGSATFRAQTPAAKASLSVSEKLNLLRTSPDPVFAEVEGMSLPVLGTYEVVVVGGGTAGAPAALAAAEQGAKTLVVEYLDELGGVGTAGLITKYWFGHQHGFTERIDEAVRNVFDPKVWSGDWEVYEKSDWLRRSIVKAGGDIWYRSFGCGALMDGNAVKGIVVATPFGRGVVKARVVIDGTGNSVIPAHAGAQTVFSIDKRGMFSVQIAGYPHRNLGNEYTNTAYALVDDCDALDAWHLMLTQRKRMGLEEHFDAGQLIDSRERRRIVGDYTLTTVDILAQRSFPDTLLQMRSNFDAAGFPNSQMLLIKDMKGPVFLANMPYRCFLPAGLDGIYSIGLGASAERDAITLVRMQPDLQNQGYAIGVAAAMAVLNNIPTRDLDIDALQKKLVEVGILPADACATPDSFPPSAEAIRAAVAEVRDMALKIDHSKGKMSNLESEVLETKNTRNYRSLAIIVAAPNLSIPVLRGVLSSATDKTHRLNYAKILAFLGDSSGTSDLVAYAKEHDWDNGYPWTQHRKQNNTFTEMDRVILALGLCQGADAAQAIHQKIHQLKPGHELSHFLAASYAFKHHPSKKLYPVLIQLLESTGFSGHVQPYSTDKLMERKNTGKNGTNSMNYAVKEVTVAGMAIAAGDPDGTGRKILEQYQNEISGHLARYANALLKSCSEL